MSDDQTLDDMLRHFSGSPFLFKKPRKLAVAVSGGGDSMACLDLMRWHAADRGFKLLAVTVDHGLREEAKGEIALVAGFCETHGVPHSVLNWSWDRKGNLQAEARRARYELIADWAKGKGVDLIALGHTQNDAAETFLMRIKRNAGLDGLAHMEQKFERFGVAWLRPILQYAREDLRNYLQRHGIAWADDPSNQDERFERVRARKVLQELQGLGIEAHDIASSAWKLWEAKQAINSVARDVAFHHVSEETGDLLVPTSFVGEARHIPEFVLTKLRCAAMNWIGGGDYAPRTEALIELDIGMNESGKHTLGGCVFSKEKTKEDNWDRWRITREHNAVKDISTPTTTLWDGRWHLSGPHSDNLEIRALGEAVKDTPWRETGMPRQSLLASPAVWRGDTLIAAPVAGLSNGWTAEATGRGNFADFLLSR